MLADLVNRTNVGMVQRGGSPGLAFEPCDANRIVAKGVWKNLDRNFASKFLVPCRVHLSHTPNAKGREDFVVPERGARLNHELIGLRI